MAPLKQRSPFLPSRLPLWSLLFGACLFFVYAIAIRAADTPALPISNQPNLPVQPIGPNDLVAISIYDLPELSRSIRVDPDGNLRIPMIGQTVKAVSLLPNQLEAKVRDAVVDAHLLNEPLVSVTVLEYHSRPVTVGGAVRNPVTFQASTPVSLIEALSRAGGLSLEAGPDIVVTRSAPGQSSKVDTVSAKHLLDGTRPDLNILLSGGEEVRVPEAGKVFVLGNVRKPGAVAVRDREESSVLRVLAVAEGLSPFATDQAVLYRPQPGGQPAETTVQLKKILERKAPDLHLDAGDILFIPDNKSRRVTTQTLERIVSFGAVTASGILVWRH